MAQKKRNTTAGENKTFVKEKVKPRYKNFQDLFDDLAEHFPQMVSTPHQLLRWQNVYYLNVAANVDEVVALRELITKKLQIEIDEIKQKSVS